LKRWSLGLYEDVIPDKKNNNKNSKMSSDVRSVTDPKAVDLYKVERAPG